MSIQRILSIYVFSVLHNNTRTPILTRRYFINYIALSLNFLNQSIPSISVFDCKSINCFVVFENHLWQTSTYENHKNVIPLFLCEYVFYECFLGWWGFLFSISIRHCKIRVSRLLSRGKFYLLYLPLLLFRGTTTYVTLWTILTKNTMIFHITFKRPR